MSNQSKKVQILFASLLFLFLGLHSACSDDSGGTNANENKNANTNGNANTNTNVNANTNNNDGPHSVELSGAVHKGPFVIGSSVAVNILDSSLSPTGDVFNTQTTSDLGEFTITFETTNPVSLEGVGYYYNEITGQLSESDLTLRALYFASLLFLKSAFDIPIPFKI